MAEITKVTTPILPQENLSGRMRPDTDQAFDLTDPTKVHKPADDQSKVAEKQPQENLRGNLGREVVQPLLKETNDLLQNLAKMVYVLQLGMSAAEMTQVPEIRKMLEQLFISPEQIAQALRQQEESAVLFKGEVFEALRDLLARFEESNPVVRQAMGDVLKSFEQHVNLQSSMRTILFNCANLLDFMFAKDRNQFSGYLDNLSEMLLGEKAVSDKEAAQILKGNLVPLLGEIVVKYHQNDRIRDIVMVVVHNIVRVDKGSAEGLRDAIHQLAQELRLVANLPERFEENLFAALREAAERAKGSQNEVISRLASIISHTLRSEDTNPAQLRGAENMLLSLLQHQSTMMNVLHFILPMQSDDGRTFAEMYVDPDNDERKGRDGESGRKIFLAVESENHGPFEFCFWEYGSRIDFNMWCSSQLVGSLSGIRGQVDAILRYHGYQLGQFQVEELKQPQTVAQVFPGLLHRKVGIDVRI